MNKLCLYIIQIHGRLFIEWYIACHQSWTSSQHVNKEQGEHLLVKRKSTQIKAQVGQCLTACDTTSHCCYPETSTVNHKTRSIQLLSSENFVSMLWLFLYFFTCTVGVFCVLQLDLSVDDSEIWQNKLKKIACNESVN